MINFRDENQHFSDAVYSLESSPLCQKLSLESFLNLPMQRVTRLPLLVDAINNMLQRTSESEEECETGRQAVEALKEVRFILQYWLCCIHLSLPFTACQKVQRDHEVDGADGEDADSVPKARLQRGGADCAPCIGVAVAGEGIRRGLHTGTRNVG